MSLLSCLVHYIVFPYKQEITKVYFLLVQIRCVSCRLPQMPWLGKKSFRVLWDVCRIWSATSFHCLCPRSITGSQSRVPNLMRKTGKSENLLFLCGPRKRKLWWTYSIISADEYYYLFKFSLLYNLLKNVRICTLILFLFLFFFLPFLTQCLVHGKHAVNVC